MNYQMLLDMIAARRKTFGFLLFLALLALAVQFYLSQWQQPELEKVQQEWFAKRDALARGETRGDSDRYQRGVKDLEQFQKLFIPKKEFAGLLSRMYESAKNNSVSMQGITFKPAPVKGTDILTYGISFNVTGNYASVKSFLADMARYRELVTVDSIRLDNSSATEEKVNLNIQTTAYLKTEGA